MNRPLNDVLYTTTAEYLKTLNRNNPPKPKAIEEALLGETVTMMDMENALRGKDRKWKIPNRLLPAQIADVIAYLHPVRRIACAGLDADETFDIIGVYQESGDNEGIYLASETELEKIARMYNYRLTVHEVREIISCLKCTLPRVEICRDRDLIAVNNGIFNYRTKQLLPFAPELVFLSKSHVDYNPAAANMNIRNWVDGTDWNVEDWMAELSDDPEVVNLLWEIVGAVIRPNVGWNKVALLYSVAGNNGKGTLCELMRNLCGPGTYTSIPFSEFGKDFMLEPLIRASAIIVDENNVGTPIDKAANLKAIVTHDIIQINRKYKTPVAYRFHGFVVQCLNEMPRIRDKSDSFFRRLLFIPFKKCFTGQERRYIKDEYLKMKEVLEYVLKRVLLTDYYELSEPAVCREALAEYKEYNDPVRQFAYEILPQCRWDLLPFGFLYSLYKAWCRENIPSGNVMSKTAFITDLLSVINGNPEWFCKGRDKKSKPSCRMSVPEPLILQYDLKDWMNSSYTGTDPDIICLPPLKAKLYCGLLRRNPVIPGSPPPTA